MKLVVEGTQAYRHYRGWGRYNELLLLGLHLRSSKSLSASVFYHENHSFQALSKRFSLSPWFKLFPVEVSGEAYQDLEEDFHNSYIDRKFSDNDVYHAITEFPFYSKQVPLICTIHELTPLIFKEQFSASYVSEFLRYVSYAVANSQRLICPSSNTKADLINYFKMDENTITVIPNCINPVFSADMTNKQSQNYLLFVGGLRKPSKNFDIFFEAYQKCISKIGHEVDLIVVNREYNQQSFEKEYPVYGVSNYPVKLLNKVTDKELVKLYQNATALIYPSYYEGFGLPIIEALACGCPVLCDGALPVVKEFLDDEVVKTNVSAVEVFAPAILDIIQNMGKHKKRAMENCNAIRGKFSLEKFIDAHIDVYRSI